MKDRTIKITLFVSALVVTVGLAALFFTMEEEKGRLSEKSIRLEEKLQSRDSAYNEIIDIMYNVESKIETIKDRENLITQTAVGEVTKQDQMQMMRDMSLIDSLILETNDKVASLADRLDKANFNLKSFQNKVGQLSADLKERQESLIALRDNLKEKDVKIIELSTDLASLETKVVNQDSTIQDQMSAINQQEDRLNTAYLAIGTKKILEEEGLVTKEGGFLGLGKTTALRQDMPQEKFEEIDIRTVKSLAIDADEAELISEHPASSYELVKEGDHVKYIRILDYQEFWKISKFLVVAVNS
ncbi:hypothetical protein [Reichenbachiella agariperforans]|uniref:Uncharacterized protein n=1 Tax=Reichenbachiella agariperforans TaxID=156994 RepID=A0A1M6KPJ2_REIAG|nr:hypothetical protein [Reichenbachiella agariperforans]MBU2913635.1 hypothetical protein [Reichenbachiella agariperforans]SHJ60774.1 hypothetical protein SAMN04488028_101655 [Reichenbachiella agariperforans]